ncbi:uncharacterized protein LOC128889563 [Hylaeus anthracinus]|uniref:uncharacterized protein LOC128889563 n=1 Tax=Hylaeus anthracinus TaxID=313031 RepID=UPI0023B969F2|nr:uncharacterized protein LOC128889563 [Hylaeus anthracinus]
MPTHVDACPTKQVVKKFVQSVPCPQAKPKKKQGVPCPAMECKKPSKYTEEVSCPTMERKTAPKCVRQTVCQRNGKDKTPRQGQKVFCPGKEFKRTVKGCPKCENNRIEHLECEVYQLRREMERMKQERKSAEKAVQKAILRGARALGGRFKPIVPGSIEKLLDSCCSDSSSTSTSGSVSYCGAKSEHLPCGHKVPKKEDSHICCQASCAR